MNSVKLYLSDLSHTIGSAWNRFWFASSDAYSLCVLRIVAGVMALYYHTSFTADLLRWFGYNGLLPIETVQHLTGASESGTNVFFFSYLYFVDIPAALWVIHLIGLAVILAFTCGLLTRITSILSLVVVLSYVNRAPMLAGLFEPVLTMLIFYLCFAPCGRYLSVDSWLSRRKNADKPSLSYGNDDEGATVWANIVTRVIQIHVVAFYVIMTLTKFRGTGWWNGEAIWGLISYSESRLIDLTFLHNADYLLDFLTHGIVFFELAFAVLIWNRTLRPLMIGLSIAYWIFMLLLTGMTGFCLTMILANLAFVSPAWLRSSFQSCCQKQTSNVESKSPEKVTATA